MIPLAEPDLSGNEARYLQECIRTGYVSSVGPFVQRFETDFAATVGVRHAIACASGTAALHVALQLAGAGPEKLVAVSDFTFIASANAVSYTGADILLVDSESDTWNMNTELLYDEVVRRSRLGLRVPDVVEVVHILGHPANIQPLLALRERFGIPIVEDAAESLGAAWTDGQQVGTVGDVGCFSFNGNKLVTTGSGGMIVTDDVDSARQARHLVNQAKIAKDQYLHDSVGYNYRLSNIGAALGVAQLERLDQISEAKRQIAHRYGHWLRDIPVSPPPKATWAHPSYWLYSVLVCDDIVAPEQVVSSSGRLGIQSRRLWPPLHLQLPYRSTERIGGEVADALYRKGISLPSSAALTENEQRIVCKRLSELLTIRSRR